MTAAGDEVRRCFPESAVHGQRMTDWMDGGRQWSTHDVNGGGGGGGHNQGFNYLREGGLGDDLRTWIPSLLYCSLSFEVKYNDRNWEFCSINNLQVSL